MSETTVVYLIHFDAPYKHAQHYLGSTADLEARLTEHHNGTGARLMQVITAAGIGWRLARTWSGGRKLERRLKTLGSAVRLCPICTPNTRWGEFQSRAFNLRPERRSHRVLVPLAPPHTTHRGVAPWLR